jgi:hypothetical protein
MNHPFGASGVWMNGGTFGKGGNANVDVFNPNNVEERIHSYVSGGGGGYYGGSAGCAGNYGYWGGPGGGGSAFISGMTGCVAIDPTSIAEPRAQDIEDITSLNATALNYSKALFGLSTTWADGAEILFTDCSMVDGAGYEWRTGVRAETPDGMPSNPSSTIPDYKGHGHARITRIQ